jgi:hypothetical protein
VAREPVLASAKCTSEQVPEEENRDSLRNIVFFTFLIKFGVILMSDSG